MKKIFLQRKKDILMKVSSYEEISLVVS